MDWNLLGLNTYESKVYEALITSGASTVSQINKISQVPQNRIYDVLESLIGKNLVYLIPEIPKRYAAESPEKLDKLINQAMDNLKQSKLKLAELKETYKSVKKQKILVSRTGKNFTKIVNQIPKAKKWSYNLKLNLDLNPAFRRNVKELEKNGVVLKTIYNKDLIGSKNEDVWKKIDSSLKPAATEEVILSMNEQGVLISLVPPKNESLIIYIENKNFAKLMKKMYEAYYNKL